MEKTTIKVKIKKLKIEKIWKDRKMLYGNVKWYNTQKGYGFIVPDNAEKDIFVHACQLEKIGLNIITTGQRIAYEPYNDRGRIAAGNLHIL